MNNNEFKKAIERVQTDTHSVVVALQLAQTTYGYITEDSVAIIADVFHVSRCTVYSTATFYHQFSFAPKGKYVISVCLGTACFVCGAQGILTSIEEELKIKAGEVTADGLFSIEHNTRCLGRCDAAPVVTINDEMLEKATADNVIKRLRELKGGNE